MIILCGGTKGGVGKTTLATNLAAMRRHDADVLLLDADKQGTASLWATIRDDAGVNPRVPCVQKQGAKLHLEVKALAEKFQDVVIDAGGRDNVELRAAMIVADIFVTPVLPSSYDFWSLTDVNRLVTDARIINPDLRVIVVVNRGSTNPSVSEVDEVRQLVSEFEGMALAETVLRDRIAYRKAASEGLGVEEMAKADAKAVAEVKGLFEEVFGHGHQ